MRDEKVDVFIAGGGLAGLIAAAGFAQAGASVCIADPNPPASGADEAGADLRSTAFLQPARELLAEIGLWPDLADHATPLDALRVIDSAGWPPEIRTERVFKASDLGEMPFGWNLPNWLTRKVLVDALGRTDRVDLRLGVAFKGMLARDREAIVTLSGGQRLAARLVVGADGRASAVRECAGIGVDTVRYGQTALAFVVTHPQPHHNVSSEIYNRGGAFTLVPLADHGDQPASAVVWMDDARRTETLLQSTTGDFEAEMNTRSCGLLGPLRLASKRGAWPVVTQTARRLSAKRTALVAEAAHVLPPIGAQGLNTSLADIASLMRIVAEMPDDPGAAPVLDRFERARIHDIRLRSGAIDLFNRVCRSDMPAVQALRGAGLRLVHDVRPLREGAMRAGLGHRGPAPQSREGSGARPAPSA